MSIQTIAVIGLGQNAYWMTTAPPGITINSAWTANGDVNAGGWTPGVVVGDFWRDVNTGVWGGSTLAQGQRWFNTGLEGSSNINSQIYGIQIVCTENNWGLGGCGWTTPPWFTVSGIELQGTENTPPSVTGQGALWSSGSYVWNPPGDPFAVALDASDVSGICSSLASLTSGEMNGPSEPRDDTVWQQCPNPVSWSFSVDTRSEVPTDGYFNINLNATNAAGVQGTDPKTVWVDNDPVGVSFRTPNDPNPTVWVNHPVTVNATPTAGPSGAGGMNCGVDRGTATSYPASGLTVDGDGVHTASCTAWNRAVGPQGQPNTGGSSMTIKIDEAPPAIAIEPSTPGDPTALVADTSDSESGVADGSIEMAPAGTENWTALPTSFDGTRLLAHVDDSGRDGPYTFRVTSCDNVGNCATSTEQLPLPLRVAADSQVSLTKIVNPLRKRVVHKRVRVGWHWVSVRRGGKLVRVKRGGHFKTIKVVKYVERCSTKRVRTAAHRWEIKRVCKRPHVHLTTTLRLAYGHKVTIHGLDTTSQGVPMAGQPVHILAAPGIVPARRNPQPDSLLEPDPRALDVLDPPAARPRRAATLIGLAAAIAVAVIATHHHSGSPPSVGLPSTPSQWVDEWTAASLENPARVCQHLVALALAAAFNTDTGRTCLSYYGTVTSSSFRIRHVIQDGPTAAVEAQQLGHGREWGYFTLILSRVRGGWQAVDIVPGGSVRPR